MTSLRLPHLVLIATSLLPTSLSAQVDLRVRADAPGRDESNLNGEWVMVSNNGTVPLDVSRWRLCNALAACYTLPDSTAIAPGGDLRIRTGAGRDNLRELHMGRGRPMWQNWADVATLRDPTGEIRARCMWDRGRGVDCTST
ncbi:MAG: lamin tail domain-containing protein [Longimicrobiales bacterium]|nr:lamin tail domain-containing protein [Longimicrobiales bacterium]